MSVCQVQGYCLTIDLRSFFGFRNVPSSIYRSMLFLRSRLPINILFRFLVRSFSRSSSSSRSRLSSLLGPSCASWTMMSSSSLSESEKDSSIDLLRSFSLKGSISSDSEDILESKCRLDYPRTLSLVVMFGRINLDASRPGSIWLINSTRLRELIGRPLFQ
jgi:hypothetical protein